MFGIILWLVLIFLIACASCPGYFTMLCTILFGCVMIYAIYNFVLAVCCQKRRRKSDLNREQHETKDRERAIDEWEKKWHKKQAHGKKAVFRHRVCKV